MNQKKTNSISMIFPMYNEERNILPMVKEAIEVLNSITDDIEIVIVDDASTDNTGKIADKLAHKDGRIKVIHHQRNRQLGGALKTGFSNATKELILYSDADRPFDMREVSRAVELIKDADIVSAYRINRTADGFRRTIYSYGYNFLIHRLFKLGVKDVNFSFKLIRRKMFDKVKLKSEGSFIDAELLIKSQYYGFKIVQFGTKYFPRHKGVSRLSSLSVIFKILKEICLLWKEIKSIKYEKNHHKC